MTDIFAQIRPALSIVGSLLIAAGLLDAAGVNIPQVGDGLRLAVSGYLLKAI
mgnify:CR=1 FL=1